MKKIIIALLVLVAGATVAVGTNIELASAHAICSTTVSAHNGIYDTYSMTCTGFTPGGEGAHGGEKARVLVKCYNAQHQPESFWRPGNWIWAPNEISTYTCPGEGIYSYGAYTATVEFGVGP